MEHAHRLTRQQMRRFVVAGAERQESDGFFRRG